MNILLDFQILGFAFGIWYSPQPEDFMKTASNFGILEFLKTVETDAKGSPTHKSGINGFETSVVSQFETLRMCSVPFFASNRNDPVRMDDLPVSAGGASRYDGYSRFRSIRLSDHLHTYTAFAEPRRHGRNHVACTLLE